LAMTVLANDILSDNPEHEWRYSLTNDNQHEASFLHFSWN